MTSLETALQAYIDEIEQTGIPCVSNSHDTLRELYRRYGKREIDSHLDSYFHKSRLNKPDMRLDICLKLH